MDADDQNLNNTKQNDDVNGSLLVNTKHPCDESSTTRIDKNGNVCNHNGVCENMSNDCNDNGIEKDEKTKLAELKAVTRLQALAMSDDEDYGESILRIKFFSWPLAHTFTYKCSIKCLCPEGHW